MSNSTPPVSYTFEVSSYPQVFAAAPAQRRRYWLHISLLLITLFTTLVVGARLETNFLHNQPAFSDDSVVLPLFHLKWLVRHPADILLGLPFSLTLMGILLAHELGHFIVAKRNGVDATLPFFIPAPTLIGTFGAVIRIKSPIRSRQALFDIGIAGPIAGFLVAVPVLFWGLALSKPMPPSAFDSSLLLGYPLIFNIVYRAVTPLMPHAVTLGNLYLHPVGVAAWVGMLATALNLLPGGQLDGGHITYAIAPRAHRWVTWASILVLIPLGIHYWPGWLVWAVILGFTGLRHPNVPKWPPLDRNRRALALLAVLMLVLTFALAPIRGLLGS
ncbi:MAG: site-2 protease family protein [Candidatus Korobacteraceae bacterium]|jgi:membrane-associated protease RseP (regulator of RpoE activity)